MSDDKSRPGHHGLPAPTAWPMVVALGLTLAGAALVTHPVVGVVGLALALIGGVGWWYQVLPEEQVEQIPLVPAAERARPIARVSATVEHLRLGEAGHRVRLPIEVQPVSAGIKGGLVGGVAMAAVAMAYGVVGQGSLWYPINVMAAVAMPSMAEAPLSVLRAFNGTALTLGIVAHGITSMLVGMFYAAILPMLPRRHTLWGGLVAPLLWTGFLWALLGLRNPALAARVDWSWFVVSQVAFGLVAGFIVHRAQPVPTAQTLPFHVRAGMHATVDREERR